MYGHKLSSLSQFCLHLQNGDAPKMMMEYMYLSGLLCHSPQKPVMSWYLADAKTGAEGTADAKKLILNAQVYATVKDVMENAFENRC